MLRKLFGSIGEVSVGGCWKLLHGSYTLKILGLSNKGWWGGWACSMHRSDQRKAYAYARTVLKWIFKKWGWMTWSGLSWIGYWQVTGRGVRSRVIFTWVHWIAESFETCSLWSGHRTRWQEMQEAKDWTGWRYSTMADSVWIVGLLNPCVNVPDQTAHIKRLEERILGKRGIQYA